MSRQKYEVNMQWDKTPGSFRKDSKTDYYYAESKEEAEGYAKEEYGHKSGFKIVSIH